MRKLLLSALVALGVASCTKEYYTIEEGAVQVNVELGANPFNVDNDDAVEVGFNLVPVSESSSKKGEASSARAVDSNFGHVFGEYTITFTRVSTGQKHAVVVGGLGSIGNAIVLPEGEQITYDIETNSADDGSILVLTNTASNSFTVPVDDASMDLVATTDKALVTVAANANISAPPTFNGASLLAIPDGNAYGDGAYLYVDAGITSKVEGVWSVTVSGTAYTGDFESAEFTTVAFDHYDYNLSITYNVQVNAGQGATSLGFTVTLEAFNQTTTTLTESFDITINEEDEDHVFTNVQFTGTANAIQAIEIASDSLPAGVTSVISTISAGDEVELEFGGNNITVTVTSVTPWSGGGGVLIIDYGNGASTPAEGDTVLVNATL